MSNQPPKSPLHRVYLASSWRNDLQASVLSDLRAEGHEVYDFKNPAPGDNGFSWRQIGDRASWTAKYFGEVVLDHPVAERGFSFDMNALAAATAVVLLLPCGRSAHLEMGYAVGAGKLTIVYQRDLDEPELMYRMCDHYVTTIGGVLGALAGRRPARWRGDAWRSHGRVAAKEIPSPHGQGTHLKGGDFDSECGQ